MRFDMNFARALSIGVLFASGAVRSQDAPAPEPAPRFQLPCDGYVGALRGAGNFGVLIPADGSPFGGTWHLAEDVWLPAGTEVRSIAAGVVRYSDFSPSWTDAQ